MIFKKMYKITISIILFGLLLSGCLEQEKRELKEKKPKIVKVLNLSNTINFKSSKEYPAQIYSFQNTLMAFEVSGKIVQFNFNVGDKIKKGDIIASLDDTIFKANFNSANAVYKKAKLDFVRYEKLYKSNSITKSKLESVQQNLDISKSNYEIAKKNFENTKLKAEFDGIIAKKYIDDFARIVAKQKIVEIQDNSKFKVKFFVPENDIMKVKQNDVKSINKDINLFVTLSSDEDIKYKAKLIDISTKAEAVTRTYEATVLIQRPKDRNILSGMTAKIQIYRKSVLDKKIFIPLNAVFTNSSNNSFIWLISNNKVYKKQIQIGKLQKDSVEVLSGLTREDKIAISGVNLLDENDEIQEYKKLGN